MPKITVNCVVIRYVLLIMTQNILKRVYLRKQQVCFAWKIERVFMRWMAHVTIRLRGDLDPSYIKDVHSHYATLHNYNWRRCAQERFIWRTVFCAKFRAVPISPCRWQNYEMKPRPRPETTQKPKESASSRQLSVFLFSYFTYSHRQLVAAYLGHSAIKTR